MGIKNESTQTKIKNLKERQYVQKKELFIYIYITFSLVV